MKIRKLFNIAFAGTALAFAACTSEEEQFNLPENSQAIEIGTYIQQGTRAVDKTAFAEGDVIGLYACQTSGDYSNTFTANFMNNVQVTKNATEWTYSPLKTWPADSSEHISFVAFYPYSTSSTSSLSYPFTVDLDSETQVEPLWCSVRDAKIDDRNGKAVNGSEADAAFNPASGALNLKFQHMLCKVNVGIKLDRAYLGIDADLNELSLCNVYGSGTFTVSGDLSSGNWSTTGESTVYALQPESDEPVDLTETETEIKEMLLIPQKVSTYPAYFDVTYTHTLREGGEKTVERRLFLPGSWEAGKIYNYVINLSLDTDNITVESSVLSMDDDSLNPNMSYEPATPVDLGLSVKWASHDLGATSAYDESPRFLWGDGDGDGLNTARPSNTSYSNPSFIPLSADIAYNYWGVNWRIPSIAEWKELFSSCTVTASEQNGIEGYLVTASNGNNIFLSEETYHTNQGYYTYSSYSSITSYTYFYTNLSTCTVTTSASAKRAIRPVFK